MHHITVPIVDEEGSWLWRVAVEGQPLYVYVDGDHMFTVRDSANTDHWNRLRTVLSMAEQGLCSLYVDRDVLPVDLDVSMFLP